MSPRAFPMIFVVVMSGAAVIGLRRLHRRNLLCSEVAGDRYVDVNCPGIEQ